MMMNSNQNEPLLEENHESPADTPSNGFPSHRQYSRGSSCELQEDRNNGLFLQNGHLCPSVPLASMDDLSDANTSLISHISTGNGESGKSSGGGEDHYYGKTGITTTCFTSESHPMQTSSPLDSESDLDDCYSLLHSSNLEHEDSSCDIALPTMNSCPTRSRLPHGVDTNHRSPHLRPPTWIEKGIESTEDLERIFVSHHEELSEEEDFDSESLDWNFLEFAEHYFAVHCPNSGTSNPLSKTVSLVRRKSQQVILLCSLYVHC